LENGLVGAALHVYLTTHPAHFATMISQSSLASTRITRSYSDDHTTLANVAEGETLVDQLRRSFDPEGTGHAVNGKARLVHDPHASDAVVPGGTHGAIRMLRRFL
jgi:hypothetical protein